MNTTEIIDSAVRKIPNFPKEGVLFYDITGILINSEAFNLCIEKMSEIYSGKRIGAVAAIEARGFVFGSPFALKHGLPLILIRKKGKLPGKTISKTFSLEYGEDEVEVHEEDLKIADNILIVDDLIATGGTLRAAADLFIEKGKNIVGAFGVIGLPFLDYRSILKNIDVTTLVEYHGESVV